MKTPRKALAIRAQIGIDHIDTPYYCDADSPGHLAVFWSNDSIFRAYFNQLDLTSIVELGCGHGRHIAQFIERAGALTLVDINEANIDICRSRFIEHNNIRFLTTTGGDLRGIEDSSQSALFSYDAMVHFEAIDVISYLDEISRVLRPGGRALLHYSNCDDMPEGSYRDHPKWRSFFSEKMMRHFGARNDLIALQSITIPWPPTHVGEQHVDAVTLFERSPRENLVSSGGK